MPEVVVLDMQKLMDESEVGKEASRTLEARFKAAQQEHRRMKEKAAQAQGDAKVTAEMEAQAYEAQALREIEDLRGRLRRALLVRAEPLVRATVEALGAKVVVDRTAIILADPTTDITYHVLSRVDAGGPLDPDAPAPADTTSSSA